MAPPSRPNKRRLVVSDSSSEEEEEENANSDSDQSEVRFIANGSDAEDTRDSFVVEDSSDDSEEEIEESGSNDEEEEEESSGSVSEDDDSDDALFPPESKFFSPQSKGGANARGGKEDKVITSAQRKSVRNGLFCSLCKLSKHPDSFSAKQRKVVDDAERYCLAHTGTSGFNRTAICKVKPNLNDSDDELPSSRNAAALNWTEEDEQKAFKHAASTGFASQSKLRFGTAAPAQSKRREVIVDLLAQYDAKEEKKDGRRAKEDASKRKKEEDEEEELLSFDYRK